ncbi:MAG TPA: shikimate kinase [Bacilli bacterium]|nr:shikimate kinase [Bacilli bacterium]
MKERIFLIGFMGTGKTTVGEHLAGRLDYRLQDSDHLIVEREGRTIPELFTTEGEPYFRQRETEALQEVAQQERVVVTTGGGAVLAATNRELMASSGVVVALTATVEEIVRRVSEDRNRPLLESAQDLRQRVESLLDARRGLYDFATITVDTTGRTVETITTEILERLSALTR